MEGRQGRLWRRAVITGEESVDRQISGRTRGRGERERGGERRGWRGEVERRGRVERRGSEERYKGEVERRGIEERER